MGRIARVVAPGYPHHITQRGNRRQQTFFTDEDYGTYIELMAEWCNRCNVEVWAYCLMPNHTHMIVVPEAEEGLRRAIGEAHRRYTRRVNFREGWKGHLWQGRFASFPMDEPHLLAAVRYVELNPVRAKLTATPGTYPWSSARAHLRGVDDQLVKVEPMLKMVDDWAAFLAGDMREREAVEIRRGERTGRPLGGEDFLKKLETALGRILQPGKPGRKRSGK
ncbi:MAG: transposase [Nitrospiraceae bacterium]|nr:transposase [Nitrospiraceae bacterium]